MKQTSKLYFEVVVEASDETLILSSHKIEPNGVGVGQKLNSVFYFFPDSKIFGRTLSNSKSYTNKIISHRMPKYEKIRYDEATNSTISTIYYEHGPNAKDEDKENEEN